MLMYAGAPWAVLRIRNTRSLSVHLDLDADDPPIDMIDLHLDELCQNVKELIRDSWSFPNFTTLVMHS